MGKADIEQQIRRYWGREAEPDSAPVRNAISDTGMLPDGRWRIKLIERLYRYGWSMQAAADDAFASLSTAYRWQNEFIKAVEKNNVHLQGIQPLG